MIARMSKYNFVLYAAQSEDNLSKSSQKILKALQEKRKEATA